ncbi:suppressor of fused domain protein [Actinomadura logoneensis]|uniref:Suppressor of fused domain protein n=1 Tax=Actinomadura logoneensis TaxID=2293572 RepID=A0A372JL39_9ACTN|nr:suppressor of fused domain protein [Actinomadura logoneensis]RFU40753.1 suppressor of fused domain protein [Actinomadura logoneensis]
MDESPGWTAIDRALGTLYGDLAPRHFATVLPFRLGGPDPLDGVSAYPRDDHWHYVSYGMSELYEKESENLDESGWGFEFTFRLARPDGEDEPPVWPVNLMQNLARYVYSSGNWFAPGHHMDANGPIAADRADCTLSALLFAEDPELGTVGTPHGRVQFLQIVGLTPDEYEVTLKWDSAALTGLLASRLPLLVSDITRPSLLTDPEIAAAVRAGIEADGSTSGALFVPEIGWTREGDGIRLRIGALQAAGVAETLPGRLAHGRELLLQSDDAMVLLVPADGGGLTVREHQGGVEIGVPVAALDGLVGALRPEAGVRAVPGLPGLVLEVVRTVIRDRDGEPTGQTVG